MGSHPLRQFYQRSLRVAFPPIRCAFAYGSAVFHQHQRQKGKMLDLIFVVNDAKAWHAENLDRNQHHYSSLSHFGSSAVAKTQRASAGVYYNTLVKFETQVLKYGVICMEDLLEDLLKWKWLYISGRLHKPVLLLTDIDEEPFLAEALKSNISSAAICAALLMEDNGTFSATDFFTTVAGLSYKGDFRMLVGEDKMKVHNIVQGSLAEFQKLYSPFLSNLIDFLPENKMMKKEGINVQSCGSQLPQVVQQNTLHGQSLQSALAKIVRASSIQQSLKGILTAGVTNSLVYSYEKLTKMMKSM